MNIKGLPGASIDIYQGFDDLDQYFGKPIEEVTQKIILENIHFDYNKATLLPESQTTLDLLASKLITYAKAKIKITGHTDNVGEEETNLKLSQARAKSVFDYLIQKGVQANRLSFEGMGETQALKSNDTKAGRALNRRVEIERIH